MGPILPDIVAEAARVLDSADADGVTLRALGGVAVHLHSTSGVHPELRRAYQDIDLVTARKQGREVGRLLTSLGYEENERFNAMNGSHRLVFYDVEHGRQLDVFVGEFRMCHVIPIADRLHMDSRTVPLAELLLTKLQVVHLNEKDLRDIWAIVHEHEVEEHDDDSINVARIAELLASDWGLWRTSRQTVETARGHLGDSALSAEDRRLVDDRLTRLWGRVEEQPKGLRWRSRARIGDRSKWYEEPEEVAHATLEPRRA